MKFKATALAMALAVSGPASASIMFGDDWGFNPDGTGLAGAITPIDEMTYLGISYTESTGFSAGDTFQDVGRLAATSFQNDAAPIPAGTSGLGIDYELTATFRDWTGTYGPTIAGNTGFTFDNGGTLNVFIDSNLDYTSFATAENGIAANPILSLSISDGEGNINFGNPGGVDGNINILFEVTDAEAGYWFLDMDDDGTAETDITALLALIGPGDPPLVVALTDSNNNITDPSAAVAADFIASTGLGNPTGPGDIYTLNDGSVTLAANVVPEPSTLGLLGLSLLGFGLVRRKAKA